MKTVATVATALTTALGMAAMPATAQTIRDTPSGPRIELRAGWDRVDIVVEYDDGTARDEAGVGESGVTYGTEIGYDFAYGPAIMGLYAGISGSNVEKCTGIYFGTTQYAEDCTKAGRDIAVGARIGYATGDNSLVYLKGGYSNGRITYRSDDLLDPAPAYRETVTLDGFHLGAGGEVGIGRHAYGKLEYAYTNYAGGEVTTPEFRISTGVERHQVFAGVGYRF